MRLTKLFAADQLWRINDNCKVVIVLMLNWSRDSVLQSYFNYALAQGKYHKWALAPQ